MCLRPLHDLCFVNWFSNPAPVVTSSINSSSVGPMCLAPFSKSCCFVMERLRWSYLQKSSYALLLFLDISIFLFPNLVFIHHSKNVFFVLLTVGSVLFSFSRACKPPRSNLLWYELLFCPLSFLFDHIIILHQCLAVAPPIPHFLVVVVVVVCFVVFSPCPCAFFFSRNMLTSWRSQNSSLRRTSARQLPLSLPKKNLANWTPSASVEALRHRSKANTHRDPPVTAAKRPPVPLSLHLDTRSEERWALVVHELRGIGGTVTSTMWSSTLSGTSSICSASCCCTRPGRVSLAASTRHSSICGTGKLTICSSSSHSDMRYWRVFGTNSTMSSAICSST